MKRIRIGCNGVQGHQIFPLAAAMQHAEIVAVSGVTDGELEKVRESAPELIGRIARYEHIAEMIECEDVDMVSVCSPRRVGQADDVVTALESHVHVYAEKPLACSASQLGRIYKAWRESGVQIRAMTGASYSGRFTRMRQLIKAGHIGQVIQVIAQKAYPYHDRRPQDPGVDGGLIGQVGIHAVSFIRWVTGLDITEVSAFDTAAGNPLSGELRMAAVLACRLSNSGTGVINLNYLNPATHEHWGDDRLRVYGTKGMVEWSAGTQGVKLLTGQEPEHLFDPLEEIRGAHLCAFIDCVLTGRRMRVDALDSFRETEIVIAAQESASRNGVPYSTHLLIQPATQPRISQGRSR